MCGIFGIIYYGNTTLPPLQAASLRTLTSKLLLAAEMRGKDASGVAILTGNDVVVYKAPLNASRLLKTNGYENVSAKINADFHAIIGHARAQTKGTYKNNHNNHPIIADKIVGVHNGMISNDDSLFLQNKNVLVRAAQVDSEIIFRLLNHFLCNPETTLIKAVQSTTKLLTGSYACAFIDSNRAKFVTLFKHWNPIDILVVPAASLIVFASVGFLARKALSDTSFAIFSVEEKHMPDNSGARISIETGDIEFFPLPEYKSWPLHSVGAALLTAPKTIESPTETVSSVKFREVVSNTEFSEGNLSRFIRRIMRRN